MYCRNTSIVPNKILLRLKVKNPPILYTIDTIDTIMTHKILLGTMEVFHYKKESEDQVCTIN
jgi:hypothetical protein